MPDTTLKPELLQYEPAVHNVAADIADDGQYEPIGHVVAKLLFDGQ